MEILQGSTIRIECVIKNTANINFDPAGLVIVVIEPSKRKNTYTYGVGNAIEHTDTGNFALNFTTREHGFHQYQINATTNTSSVSIGSFVVKKSIS